LSDSTKIPEAVEKKNKGTIWRASHDRESAESMAVQYNHWEWHFCRTITIENGLLEQQIIIENDRYCT
jgi:hypothetical protein